MVKNPSASAGDEGDARSMLRSGRSPGAGNDNLLQYSCLENPMGRGAWQVGVGTVWVAKSQIRLPD